MIKKYYFALPRHAGSHVLAEALADAGLAFRRRSSTLATRTFYDSFDWRLYRAGLLLTTDQVDERLRLTLQSFRDGLDLVGMDVSDAPRFAGELPGGLVRERVAPLLGERRLLPVAYIHSRSDRIDVHDEETKTVARLCVGRHHVDGGDGSTSTRMRDRLELIPVRGFGEALKTLRVLVEQTLAWEPLDQCLFEEALEELGRQPADYHSRPEVELDPQMPAGAAARRLLAAMFGLLEANEDGVRQDLDTEFLHDLRVAVRRTRALLGQMKGLLAAPHFDHYREEFAWLGAVTGNVRDLDVLLLRFPEYASWIEAEHKEDLEPVRAAMKSQRGRERRALLEDLASARYRGLKKGWRQLLDDGGRWERGEAASAVLPRAQALIRHRHDKILALGERLDASSSAEDFHELRRQCKKLRYLIESFESLFPAAEIKPVLRLIKDLQNNLGELQDLSIHAQRMQTYANAMPPNGERGERTRRALGLVLERMELRRRAIYVDFAHAYAGFASSINRRRFAGLAGDAEKGAET